MKYKIISYNPHLNLHVLKGDIGLPVSVDLFVDSSFEGMENVDFDTQAEIIAHRESLVGETVEIESLHPIDYFAANVKLIKQTVEKQ